eukprot:gene17802-12754_t
MGSVCCGFGASHQTLEEPLSPEEVESRRRQQAEAAEQRAKSFQQGGGGDKLKAKAKAEGRRDGHGASETCATGGRWPAGSIATSSLSLGPLGGWRTSAPKRTAGSRLRLEGPRSRCAWPASLSSRRVSAV